VLAPDIQIADQISKRSQTGPQAVNVLAITRKLNHLSLVTGVLLITGITALLEFTLQSFGPDTSLVLALSSIEQLNIWTFGIVALVSFTLALAIFWLSKSAIKPLNAYQSLISGTEGDVFRSLIYEIDPSCMKVIDSDGRIHAINQAGLDMLEADSYEDVEGQLVDSLLLPHHSKPFADMISRTLSGETTNIEFEVNTLLQNRRWFHQVARSYFCESTKQTVLFCITRDITQSKLNKDRLDLAIDVTNQGLWDEQLQTDRLFYNSNWYTMLGYAPGELPMTSDAWRNLVHPEDIDEANAEFSRHANQECPKYSSEFRMRAKDGSWKWIKDVGRIIERSEDDIPVRAIGLHIDIDAAKRHELTLGSVVSLDATTGGTSTLTELCRTVAEAYDIESVGVTKLTEDDYGTVVAGWSGGKQTEGFAYDLCGTPCSVAVNSGYCHYERDVCSKFPDDDIIIEMNAVGYSGLVLCGSNGKRIGILYVITTKPLFYTKELESTIRLIGARAAAELERQIIKESLTASQDRLNLAMEAAKFGLWDWDAETGELFFSSEVYGMLGYNPDDHPDALVWWRSVCHAEDVDSISELLTTETTHSTPTSESELRLKRSDGSWQWFKKSNDVVLCPKSGQPSRIIGLLSDNHTSKLNQIELERTKELLEETGKIAKVGGWEIMLADNSLRWTDQTYRIHELEIGSPIDVDTAVRFYIDESESQIKSLIHKCLEDGTPWDTELRIRTAMGNTIWIRAVGVIELREGIQYRLYGTFQDITESKNIRLKLEEAKDAAESASRAKSDFLANMSHEIRTPMTAIVGNADLLARNGKLTQDPELLDSAVRSIGRNADHLLSIINDILDTSKIDAGMMIIEQVELSPCKLIDESTDMLFTRAADKDIDISIEYTSELPRRIESDPTRIRQILINLVGNAIKFTDTGHVRVEIGYNTLPNQHGLITFRVVDSGIGISASNLENLRKFEAFAQADGTTTRKFGGTGLGLRITNALVMKLGGTLSINSELGIGTTVTASLQVKPIHDGGMWQPPMRFSDSLSDPEKASNSDLTTESLKGKCILLVEDGKDNQVLLNHMLRSAGIKVVNAVNGADALRLYQHQTSGQESYDLILMDMQMPVIDGYSATKSLRTLGYPGPIVALTAHAMAGDRERCLAAGCQDYLSKPVRAATLLETCAKHLGVIINQSKSA
jgi:PAS domain S-box-containing protein